MRWFLTLLHGLDEAGRFQQAVVRPGVEPGESAAELLHVQVAPREIARVHVADLQLAACARLDVRGNAGDVVVVEVEAGHGPVGARMRGFLLDGDGAPAPVEGDHPVTLGVTHLVGEDRGALAPGARVS